MVPLYPLLTRNRSSMQTIKMQLIRALHNGFVQAKAIRIIGIFAFALVVQLASLACLIPHAGALEEVAAPVDEPRFTVELIVFSYRAANSAGNEVFVPDEPTLVPDAEEELPPDVAQNTFGDIPEQLPPEFSDAGATVEVEDDQDPESKRIELHLLDSENYTMGDIYRKLQQLEAYQPIMHAAWTQTTPPKETAPAVHLRALGQPPPGLDGSVTLYRGRYLHLVVDLALEASGPDARQNMMSTDRLVTYGDRPTRESDGRDVFDPIPVQPVRYRILEDRIMKTGDLRYFDHPRFGVVARITEPEDDPAAQDAVSGGT